MSLLTPSATGFSPDRLEEEGSHAEQPTHLEGTLPFRSAPDGLSSANSGSNERSRAPLNAIAERTTLVLNIRGLILCRRVGAEPLD
ncbi:hypothetical protein JRQ81_006395 [Phrynocephalus forsythii]|uniref:Uncharacterized protein n=1 Tax=Phrynocephalus forsythii TaxID=171643 RepID=A0A9Q1AUA7_9SAUR|nr:hypothetical protein JRQ81_006395 [Phrynocephalus forsythii]